MATVIERLREICPQPGRGKIFIWEQVQFVYTHLPALLALAEAVKEEFGGIEDFGPAATVYVRGEGLAKIGAALADLEKESQ